MNSVILPPETVLEELSMSNTADEQQQRCGLSSTMCVSDGYL